MRLPFHNTLLITAVAVGLGLVAEVAFPKAGAAHDAGHAAAFISVAQTGEM